MSSRIKNQDIHRLSVKARVLLCLLSLCTYLSAQGLVLELNPAVDFPFGPWTDGAGGISAVAVPGYEKMYTIGGGGRMDARMPFLNLGGLSVDASVAYNLNRVLNNTNLSRFTFAAGPGWNLSFLDRFVVSLGAYGGTMLSVHPSSSRAGLVPMAGAKASFSYRLSPSFALGLGGSYDWSSTYSGASVFLGTSFSISARGAKARLEISEIVPEPIFPVFLTYYDKNSFGTITIKNGESDTLNNVRVSFFVPKYMDGPKDCIVIPELASGKQASSPILAPFTESVLLITEGLSVMAQVSVDYELLGTQKHVEKTQTIQFYDRNALTWDDDKKVAAFVTAKDPAVLVYSKGISGVVRDAGPPAIPEAFRLALGLFDSLDEYGVRYVVDPKSSYASLSVSAQTVDFVQFPRQTLEYRAGDCDDLMVLFCALLESVGVETAAITVPGHIYAAISLGDYAANQWALFPELGANVIKFEGTAWLPVEITMIREGFVEAVKTGGKEYRDAGDKAAMFPTHASWKIYAPVAAPGEKTLRTMDPAVALKAYQRGFSAFAKAELAPLVKKLRDEAGQKGNAPAIHNRIGILYAKFGLYQDAAEAFSAAAAGGYGASLINLANVYSLLGRERDALDSYKKAYAIKADTKTLALITRLQDKLGDAADFGSNLAILKQQDPTLSARVAPGGTGTDRGSAADFADLFTWPE